MWGSARLLRPRGVRHMGATGGGGYGTGEYRGLKVPPVAAWHQHVATFFGCTMWLWIFWRFKNDGKALMVRAARAAAPRANIPPPHVFLARVGAPPQGLPFLNRGLQACQSPPDHKLRQRAFSWPAVSIPDGRHTRALAARALTPARPPPRAQGLEHPWEHGHGHGDDHGDHGDHGHGDSHDHGHGGHH